MTLATPMAWGATITQTWDTGLNQTDVNLSNMFNQFDPTLGALNSVTITLNGTTERDVLFQNLSTSSGAKLNVASGAWISQFTVTGPDGTNLTGTDSSAKISLSTTVYGNEGSSTAVDNGNGTTTIAGTTFTNAHLAIVSGGPSVYTDVATYYKTTSLAQQSETLTSGLGTFLGNSTFTTLTNLGYSYTGGNAYTALQTWADANVTVTYNYTSVPLPASLWLMLSGIGGLGVLARSRKIALA